MASKFHKKTVNSRRVIRQQKRWNNTKKYKYVRRKNNEG